MEMSSRGCSALRPFACIRWKQARQKKPYTNGHKNFKQVKSIRVSLHSKKNAICKALASHSQRLEEFGYRIRGVASSSEKQIRLRPKSPHMQDSNRQVLHHIPSGVGQDMATQFG